LWHFDDMAQDQSAIKSPILLWGFILVPLIGFELMTYRLQGGCSTN
jgi:hypothetical protein